MKKELTPGFDYQEAKELLGMALSADIFSPTSVGVAWINFNTMQTPPENNPINPIPPDIEETYPYPEKPIWPRNWRPAMKPTTNNVWESSILTSTIPGVNPGDPPIKSNSAMICYDEGRDAYCVAFAGTTNLSTIMQDELYTPTPAGPTIMFKGSDQYRYESKTAYLKNWNFMSNIPLGSHDLEDSALFAQPPVVMPKVSLGIRFGLETLTTHGDPNNNLITAFQKTGKKEINLFITGHSLGAGIASLFAAWLGAGNIPGIKFNIKTYAFAPEKLGNEAFIDRFNIDHANFGMHFVIKNDLDIAPQLPLTIGKMKDLTNPKGTRTWLPYVTQVLLAEYGELLGVGEIGINLADCGNTNYFHPGWAITLKAQYPVIFNQKNYPPIFFPNKTEPVPVENQYTDPFTIAFLRIWWQHMPWNYRLYLDRTFGPKK